MEIKLKQVIELTTEEKQIINKAYVLMNEILEQINEIEIYNAVKKICDGFEEFDWLVDTDID